MKNNQNLKQYCLQSMRSHTRIKQIVQDVTPKGGGMLPSEMLLFASVCVEQGITHVIESGRKLGFSTEVLCKCGCFEIWSIDNDPIEESDATLKNLYPELKILRGNGNKMVASLVSELNVRRIAVLLDGPKNTTGCKVFKRIKQNITIAGIHDVCKKNELGELNPGRITLETKHDSFFSDDTDLLKEFGEIDAEFLHPSYSCHSDLLPYSCVLGVAKGGKWNYVLP